MNLRMRMRDSKGKLLLWSLKEIPIQMRMRIGKRIRMKDEFESEFKQLVDVCVDVCKLNLNAINCKTYSTSSSTL